MKEKQVDAVVSLLLGQGWRETGSTRRETVRLPTQESPVLGRAGGRLATFGGRRKFEKGCMVATVGPRTTWIATLVNGRAQPPGAHCSTDVDTVSAALNELANMT